MYEGRAAAGNYTGNYSARYGSFAGENQNTVMRPWVRAAVILVMFCSFGFPGTYIKVFGPSVEVITRYGIFFLQLFLMLVLSGDRIGEIKLIDIKPKYTPIYLFLATIFAVSMIATSEKGEEVVSCIRFSVTALFAIWLCEHFDVEELLGLIYRSMILYVAAAVTFAVLFPGLYDRKGDQQMAFLGMEDNKNVTAMILLFGIVMQLLLWRIRTSDNVSVSSFFVGFLAVQLFLLVLSNSKGALVYCAAVVLLVLAAGDRFRVNVGMVCVLSSILFLVFAMTVLPMLEPLLNVIGKDATLTGRVPLWHQLLDVIRENHPLIGYGYGHFWYDKEALDLLHVGFSKTSFMNEITTGSHNSLIEMWVNTGLIGLLAYFAMLIAAFSRPRQIPADKYVFCMAYMAFFTLSGFTERCFGTFGYKMLFLFVAVAMGCQKTENGSIKHRQVYN